MADDRKKPTKSKTPPAEPAPKSRFRRLARVGAWLGGIGLVGTVLGSGILYWEYRHHVVDDPGPHLDREHIRSIISQESPVYYRDGTTRVGVFFEDEHRQYVPWEELPRAYTVAIVAAEDGQFWSHGGISAKHIVRAMLQNVTAGELVAGGSTLTQQTAKNLYYRPDRSLRSKWTELLNALRLEEHYSKAEILTFYANQFHVSGNGRGLGIAARYFFDKEVSELTVAESAYLAGLVKGPSNYDPFLGDAARRDRARERAHQRTRYVLRRIVDEPAENLAGPRPERGDPKSEAEYQDRLAEVGKLKAEAQKLLDDGFELAFKKGTFRYDSNAVLDEVARRLEEPPFKDVLAAAGIDDPSTAGLVVVTTLDADAQREATYGLWHHLTEVGTMMEALGPEDYVREGRGPYWEPDRPLRPHEFRLASVQSHDGADGKRTLTLDLGGRTCPVDRDGLVRVAVASVRGQKKDKSAKASSAQIDAFANAIADGSVVYASVREVKPDGTGVCDLEVRPTLQGATVVLEDGQIRAMVSGNDNRNFNRAGALRQMGSTWKPLVYHAAMELGWSPSDRLDNTRNVFPFSTTFYYPSPDHAPAPTVSMSWAGVNSENLASIWLLYHLTDKLSGEQVRVLAEALGMAPTAGESKEAWRARIQKMGVLPTPRRVEEALFLQARQEVGLAAPRSRHPEDELALSSLLYGWGFAGERERVQDEPKATKAWKERALDNSWLALKERVGPCRDQHRLLDRALRDKGLPPAEDIPDLTVLVDGEAVKVACGAVPTGYVPPDEELLAALFGEPEPEVEPADTDAPAELPEEPGDDADRRKGLLGRLFGAGDDSDEAGADDGGGGVLSWFRKSDRPKLVEAEDVLVEDRLHVSTLEALDSAVQRRRLARETAGEDAADLYDPELLYWHQDFRVLLGMKYVARMAREYGVRTEVREVLSMPLGASEITLEEATAVYEGLVTGSAWEFPGRARSASALVGTDVASPPAPTLLIAEIRDVDGNVLYSAEPKERPVASERTGELTADILRNVVRHGTGRRALDAIPADGAPVPVGGKTGTTNDFRNAAFIGFVPKAEGASWSVEDGFVVGVYVGYDDNREMDVGNIRLAGASGALPAWLGAASGLWGAGLLGAPSGTPVEGEWPLVTSASVALQPVDAEVGLPLAGDAPAPVGDEAPAARAQILVPAAEPRPEVDVHFSEGDLPVRVAPSTEDALTPDLDRPELWVPPAVEEEAPLGPE
jgi:penicillin-binding protein 1A